MPDHSELEYYSEMARDSAWQLMRSGLVKQQTSALTLFVQMP